MTGSHQKVMHTISFRYLLGGYKRLVWVFLLLLPSAAAQVESHFHSTVFRSPKGWQTREQNGVLLVAPTDPQRNPEIAVMILPGADIRVSFTADFDQFVEKLLAAETVLSSEPVDQPQPLAYAVKSRLVLLKTKSSDRAVRWFIGANPGGRFEMVLVVASSESVFSRYNSDLKFLFGSLNYVAAPAAPAKVPPGDSSPGTAPAKTAAGSLIGHWRSGSISSISFYNRATGVWAPPSGIGMAYSFEPDGTYTNAQLLQTSMYGCTTTFFSWRAGKYIVQGNQVTLTETESSSKQTDTCNPSRDRAGSRPLVVERLIWRVVREQSGLVLGLLDPSKNYGEIQYRPE